MIAESDLSRADAGVIKTRAGRWHVFRRGSPFSCARGATDPFEEAGPYVAVETVPEAATGRLPHRTTRDVQDLLRAKRDARGTICLHCASCYDVSIHPSVDE